MGQLSAVVCEIWRESTSLRGTWYDVLTDFLSNTTRRLIPQCSILGRSGDGQTEAGAQEVSFATPLALEMSLGTS
jgi:hypothetical protein